MAAVEAMRTAAQHLRAAEPGPPSGAQCRDTLRAVQAAQDALDAIKAEYLAALETSGAYEADGASSLKVWARNELRLDAHETKVLTAAGETMRLLPEVGQAAREGRLHLGHLKSFTYGLRHVGADIMRESQPWLLETAVVCEPTELHGVVRALREAVHPDELDKAWADGMDKQDIQVNALPTGWHVIGFLDTALGAKLRAVLDSLGAPRDADDERTPAECRTDALDELLTTVIENGLPSDKGIRPHLTIIADLETVQTAVRPSPFHQAVQPAQLVGFGSIGLQLLSYLACNADVTPILTDGLTTGDVPQAKVLNVGRSHRLATLKQRRAVIARQGGECAAPGCHGTHLEMHHRHWWSDGGPTDIDELVGLCARCHQLVHRRLLTIEKDGHGGFRFLNHDRRLLRREHRQRLERHREARRIVRARLKHEARRAPRLRM